MKTIRNILIAFVVLGINCTSTMAIITYGEQQNYNGFKVIKGDLNFEEIKPELFSMEHMGKLRQIYNQWLKVKNGIKGKLSVSLKFINCGNLLEVTYHSSNLKDSLLEKDLLKEISSWHLCILPSQNDTNIIYVPFVFSQ
jgi:hypothetical protein